MGNSTLTYLIQNNFCGKEFVVKELSVMVANIPSRYNELSLQFLFVTSYVKAGCSGLKVVLKNFASVIKSNVAAPPSVGVDISREERYCTNVMFVF